MFRFIRNILILLVGAVLLFPMINSMLQGGLWNQPGTVDDYQPMAVDTNTNAQSESNGQNDMMSDLSNQFSSVIDSNPSANVNDSGNSNVNVVVNAGSGPDGGSNDFNLTTSSSCSMAAMQDREIRRLCTQVSAQAGPPEQDNTVLLIGAGIVVVLFVVLIFFGFSNSGKNNGTVYYMPTSSSERGIPGLDPNDTFGG